jgi:hypothetical protein
LGSDHTEQREFYPDQLARAENLTNVRGMSLDGDQLAFQLFFDKLLPAVAGRKVWTARDRATKTISEAAKLVTVLDEAFLILALENYWPRWSSMHLTSKVSTLWTDNRSGNYQYMGWADDAYRRFDVLCHRIRDQRQNSVNKELERLFLKNARSEMARGGVERQPPTAARSNEVEIYDELDDDDDDDE